MRCLNGVRPRWPEQLTKTITFLQDQYIVSMESGLDGRNNHEPDFSGDDTNQVSMESGLDGRNNCAKGHNSSSQDTSLNGVRPRWPEQLVFDKI